MSFAQSLRLTSFISRENRMVSFLDRVLGNQIEEKAPEIPQRIVGKVIKISDKGWGFISSPEIKYTRIFFHWTALTQDTLNFAELKLGMKVEFKPIRIPDKGYRAIQISVIQSEEHDS